MISDRELDAGQRFLLACKGWWTTTLYSRVREEYVKRAGEADAAHSVSDVAAIVEDLTVYRYFSWLERHLQRMKYSGRYGLARYYDERRENVLGRLNAGEADGMLELRPDIKLPNYYTSVDIHQHPGGVWSDDVAGFVYEHGARTTTPLLGEAHKNLHVRLAELVAAEGEPSRVLDLGCGFGKSTLPIAERFPGSRVEGIDFSAPCLRLAAGTAKQAGVANVRYRQADAADTGFPDASFDLVTSTMLLHELPPKAVERVLSEAERVLQPGGRMVHLDFYYFPDAFARFMHYGHGRRNNEPFMQPVAELELPQLMRRHGFTDVKIVPFREADDLGPERTDTWRFPWTVISGRKPDSPEA
ncbi:MAG TPA: class I SAM-dependent methyltransferase [Steroidobacteraceae bacterium]|nr:class I SAM-dependent methyltransferase [Steroidobacteraceae bacterium]